MQFQFMPQSLVVQGLLDACLQALPLLPPAEKNALHKEVKMFERYASTPLWTAADVDASGDIGLTDSERHEAIARYAEHREPSESDWGAIDSWARQVLSERQVCIKVEYDLAYSGGDYHGVGQTQFIPLAAIEAARLEDETADPVKLAFEKETKHSSIHIVSFNLDELFNQHGESLIECDDDEDDDEGEQESQAIRSDSEDAAKLSVLSKEDLSSLGYQVLEDGDHPGRYYWVDAWSESKETYPKESEAVADASGNAFAAFAPLSRCDNCDLVHSEAQLHEIKKYSMRVEPGGMVPSGQCRECGCLTYPIGSN